MKNSKEILEKLDKVVPNPVCELNYKKDYELLIATVLAAQSTDKRVNEVTKVLFSKYDIFSLAKENIKNIEDIISSENNQWKINASAESSKDTAST